VIQLGLNTGPDKPECAICKRLPLPSFRLCLICAEALDRAWRCLAEIPEAERAAVYKRLIGG
jgi:hypothetical protein